MKLTIHKLEPLANCHHLMRFFIEHDAMVMTGYEYLTTDELEDLELNLTNFVKRLYEYRVSHQGE